MITLKLKVGRATNGGAQDPGQIIRVPEEEGLRMIRKGQAVRAKKSEAEAFDELEETSETSEETADAPEPEVERASVGPTENASKPSRRKK